MEIELFEFFFISILCFGAGYLVCRLHRADIEDRMSRQISELKSHVKSMQSWMRDANGKDI